MTNPADNLQTPDKTAQDSTVLPYASKFYSGWGQWGLFNCHRDSREIEFPENPSRSIALADKLQAVVDNPIGSTALGITTALVLSSSEGDEIGITVERDEEVRTRTSANRMVDLARHALSGFSLDDLWQIVWRFLAWGDCFASVVEDETERLVPRLLPTWQIHLEVDEWDGSLSRILHKRPGIQKAIEIQPETFIHWCYQKNYLYGRSLFWAVRDQAEYYRQNDEDIALASRDAALNPNIHEMPEGADDSYLEAYRRDHKQQLLKGPVSDIYVLSGGSVSKPIAGSAAPLAAMLDALKLREKQIAIASKVPPYLLGIETSGAKEISLQPAMVFKNHIGWCRTILANQLKTCIDRYLSERGFSAPYPYALIFPKIELNPYQPGLEEDMDAEGVVDNDG